MQNQVHFCVPLDQEIHVQVQVEEFKLLHFLPKHQGFVFLGGFQGQNTKLEQNLMTPYATCRVPLGMLACKKFLASDTWNWGKTLMISDQDQPLKSEILNPSEIIIRSSIAEPSAFLCST